MSGIKKPDKQYPKVQNRSIPYPSHMPELIQDPSIHGGSFDQLLQNRGIRFIHKKAMPCPNLSSVNSNSHDPNCTICDNSQIYYYEEHEIWGAWASNRLEKLFEVQGVWEIGTAVVSFPTIYPNIDKQADFNTFDQIVIPDFEIRLNDLFEYEPRDNNVQKLRYNINSVEHLASADKQGNIKIYEEGEDFVLQDGGISWIQGKEPDYDEETEVGEVLSISYTANPVYTVLNVLHELRATQEMGHDGVKKARRLQQQVLVRRDFLVNEDERSHRDPSEPESD